MASIISAGTTSGTALNMAGDTSGQLQLATNGSTTALTIDTSQNITFNGTRIYGDFINATLANRVLFQSSTTNSNTSVGAIPNGTESIANFRAYGASDPTNSSFIEMVMVGATDARFSSGIVGSGTYLPMTFYTGGSERMRIDTSGNVGIGNTGNANWKLLVSNGGLYTLGSGANGYFCVRGNNQTLPNSDNGTADTPNLAITVNFSNGSAEVDYFNCNNSGDGHHFYQKTGAAAATNIMKISGGGNLTISGATATKASGTTWSNPSDQRLKDNIRDYTKGTTELMQVRVREWEYNGKGGTTEGLKGLGVVADEVMTVLPNTVETYNAKLNADDEEDTEIKKFDATEITWLLVKTVQEQQTIINDLKARITALEGAA
jgi:hypothetical protein